MSAALRNELAGIASRSGFVLRVGELNALGISRSRARWAVRQSVWSSPGRGVVAPVDVHTDLPGKSADFVLSRRHHALAGTGSALVHPGDAICGRTAAVLHGLPVMTLPHLPELAARDDTGMGYRPAVHLFAGRLPAHQVTQWFGADVSDVARTLVDLGRHDRRDAIMASDAALREDLVTRTQIDCALRVAYRWPGVRQARAVLALADSRAESPLESITRLAIHDAGLPAPDLQAWLDVDRVDFYWPRYGLVLEADGRVKYTTEERWAEKRREQRLRRHDGVRQVERVTWADVTRDWIATERVLRRALR